MPIVIILVYNRLHLPLKMAQWVAARGCEPVFVDNNSDYPPLLEFYKTSPFRVLRLKANYGHTTLWNIDLLGMLGIKERFIYTDPDLELEGIPDDFLTVLNNGLDKYPQYSKCGFSLEINDLPDDQEGNFIKYGPEKPYWEKPLDDLYFDADTDTTFALYRYPIGEYGHSALRTNRPYTARHLPWYYRDYSLLPEDEQYYYHTARTEFSSGLKRIRK